MTSLKWPLVILVVLVAAFIGLMVFVQPAMQQTQRKVVQENTPTNSGSSGKLNINAICEGALAYMTFPSGAEAEAWVAECKNGEHPETVEQWKQQQGITDDRAI